MHGLQPRWRTSHPPILPPPSKQLLLFSAQHLAEPWGESWVPVTVCTCPAGILMLEGAHQMAN